MLPLLRYQQSIRQPDWCHCSDSTVLQPIPPNWQLYKWGTCEAPTIPFFQSLIVLWWKLIYYVCMLFCMQNTKIYKKTWEITIQGLSKAEDYILCPDWMTVFFLNSFDFLWCLPEAGLLTAQPTFTEILSADSIKSSSLCFAMVFGIIFLPIWMWWKELPESVRSSFLVQFELHWLGW